jgi:hypothetical protein
LDDKALRWLDEHPTQGALVLALTVTRCCRGTRVRDVRLRPERKSDRPSQRLLEIGAINGREVLMDSRIVGLLPPRIPGTVRGIGRFKSLSLISAASSGIGCCTRSRVRDGDHSPIADAHPELAVRLTRHIAGRIIDVRQAFGRTIA